MEHLPPLAQFIEPPYYSAHFMDPMIWEPYVRRVLSTCGFDCRRVLPGYPGTYPTFLAELISQQAHPGLRWVVVKFFGQLFEGKASFMVERALGHYLAQQSLSIPSPTILADGQLAEGWFYLVFEHIPGVRIGQVRTNLSPDAWHRVAVQLGKYLKELHSLFALNHSFFLPSSFPTYWLEFAAFLENQRANVYNNHLRWGDLPFEWIEQLPAFIPPVEQLVDHTSPLSLIHADLTADHLLGRLVRKKRSSVELPAKDSCIALKKDWKNLAIIDWGDCRMGNILYELAALHVDLFRFDKNLLSACLEAYDLPPFYTLDFARKALSMLLLHQYPLPAWISQAYQDVGSLPSLADRVFGL